MFLRLYCLLYLCFFLLNFIANIQESGLFMDAMLNVLNSAPKIPKKRKPKPETGKKNNCDTSPPTAPLSPQPHIKLESQSPSRSPVHSPSTLDLDSLTNPQSQSADESLSFTESSDYIPLSAAETATDVTEDPVTSDPEPTVNVEPIVEKPPQLKVCNTYRISNTSQYITICLKL